MLSTCAGIRRCARRKVRSTSLPTCRLGKWNYLFGRNWQPDKRWSITAEVGGLADRVQFIASVMWRF